MRGLTRKESLKKLTIFTRSLSNSQESLVVWDGTAIDTVWYNTTDTTFTLNTGAQLSGLAAIVNGTANGITADSFAGKTVILGSDIDLNNKNWIPIGTSNGVSTMFAGTFNGQKHVISNLSINISETSTYGIRYGFFGVISGIAREINFKGARVITTASCFSGVIAGYINGGTVSRCTIDAGSVVECYTQANGMVAGRVEKTGTIDSCINYGTITGYGLSADTTNVILGGIVGLAASSVVKNCINYGDVTAHVQTGTPSQAGAAGIAGYINLAQISNCVNYGNISLTDYFNKNTGVSGIVGKFHATSNSTITNCYNFGNIESKDGDTTQTGLILGLAQVPGTINSCYSVTIGNLGAAGSGMHPSTMITNFTIVGKTDSAYEAMEKAAAAIESSISDVTNQLIIHYIFTGGEKAAEDVVGDYREGDEYSIDSPTIVGYTPDQETISGKMVNIKKEISVTYSVKNCELTIEYVYEDGSKAADSYISTQPYGTEFSVNSPEIPGYDPNFTVVKGKYETNRTITAKYKSKGTLTSAVPEEISSDTTAVTAPAASGGCGSIVSCGILFLITVIFGMFFILNIKHKNSTKI